MNDDLLGTPTEQYNQTLDAILAEEARILQAKMLEEPEVYTRKPNRQERRAQARRDRKQKFVNKPGGSNG